MGHFHESPKFGARVDRAVCATRGLVNPVKGPRLAVTVVANALTMAAPLFSSSVVRRTGTRKTSGVKSFRWPTLSSQSYNSSISIGEERSWLAIVGWKHWF